jgi:hypothetical protein
MSKSRTTIRSFPASALGWYSYYAKQYNKTESPDAMYLAQVNYLFYLAFGNEVVAA